MKKLKSEFAKKRISKYSLRRLYNHLKDSSSSKKLLNIRENSLKNIIIEVVKNFIVPKDIMEDYNKSKRVAKTLEDIICIKSSSVDEYLGVKDNTIEKPVDFSMCSNTLGIPEFRTNQEKKDSGWSRFIYVDLDKITDNVLREKLVQIFISYRKAKNNFENFLKVDYNYIGDSSYYGFLNGYTWAKLYELNKNWFDWLLEFEGISEDSVYKLESDDEPDYSTILEELKLFLES